MADLPDAIDEIRSPDLCGVAEFHDLLGSDAFRAFLAEVTDAIDSGSNPSEFWARWIDVVVKQTRRFSA